ncbi:MAG: hypothetical protein ACKVS6_12390 [Planctomycetota bacterium]
MLQKIFASAALAGALAFPSFAQDPFSLSYVTPPTPERESVYTIYEGDTIDFDVVLIDVDPNSTAAFDIFEVPPGTIVTPPAPQVVVGDGVNPIMISTHFTWTAPTGSAGQQFIFYYDGANLAGARLPNGFYVNVLSKIGGGDPEYCSFTQGGWGSKGTGEGNNPGKLLAQNFFNVYGPAGVEIGIHGSSGKSVKFTNAAAIEAFLPAGGKAGKLKLDATNPKTTAAGVFAGQVLALQLNVDFSNAGITESGFGGLILTNTGNAALDGNTIAEVLAAANIALGGGALPFGFTNISQLNDLVTKLNESFDNCKASDWAKGQLTE